MIHFRGVSNFNLDATFPIRPVSEVQRLNGEAYGKGIYAATDLKYGKGFGRRQVELNGTGDVGGVQLLPRREGMIVGDICRLYNAVLYLPRYKVVYILIHSLSKCL